jgi:hypothetical protein
MIVYFSSMKMGFEKRRSFFVSLFSLAFIFMGYSNSLVHVTLNQGLASQLLALDLLVVFMGFLLSHGKSGFIIPGILLGLIILAHTYVGVLAAFMILVFFLTEMKKPKRAARYALCVSVLGLAVSSFWVIPFLANAPFAKFYGSPPVNLQGLLEFPLIVALLIPFSLRGLVRNKPAVIMLAAFAVTLTIGVLGGPLENVHYFRFFTYAVLFGSMLAGIGMHNLSAFLKKRYRINTNVITLSAVSVVLVLALLANVTISWENNIETGNLAIWVRDHASGGRMLTEFDSEWYSMRQTLDSLPVSTDRPVMAQLHADSVSSQYVFALQSQISPNWKELGIKCYACRNFPADDKALLLSQLGRFNVRYVVSVTNESRQFMGSFCSQIKAADGFYVFEVPGNFTYYEIPEYRPVLVVSDLASWEEFNYAAFFDKDLQNLTFVWTPSLDGIDTDAFGAVLHLGGQGDGAYAIRENESMADFIVRIKPHIYSEAGYATEIRDFTFDEKSISFHVDFDEPVPVLLKFSYFPYWRSGGRVYLASPSLMMVFASGAVRLDYRVF